MSSELKPPIILFGNTRSGATIVQQLMAVHPDIVKWYEPNAIWLYADPGRGHDEFDESDATDRGKRYIRKQFLKFQKQHGNGIVMEKTPQNILRIPYVRAIFPEAAFLFIVRNPFSFINSVELKWQRTVTARGIVRRLKDTPVSQLHHWGRRLMVQQINKRVLRRKYLSIWGPRYKGIQQDLKTQDLLTVIAKQWSVCSRKAEKDLALLGNGRILRLKYEDFVEDPISDLERICSHCGLEMTNDMVKAAKEWVKADRQDKWRRFDPRDLARILPEISGEMQRHGYEIPPEIAQIIGNETRTAKSSTAVTPTETVRKPRAFTIESTMSFHHLQPPSKALVDTRKSLRATPEILCTLGPASLDRRTIQRLEQSGATLFRINLSHTKLADLPRIIRTIREATPVPICLDTEGAQIRTGEFIDGSINVRDNTMVRVHFRRVPADDKNFNFYPLEIAKLLQLGDFVSIDFNAVLVQVIARDNDCVLMRVLQGGLVGQNKAVTVERDIPMPPLTEKDQAALTLGCEMGLSHFALSFASRGEDVRELRRLVGETAFVISKIESRNGLKNLEEIAAGSGALLIDRGDLSRQVPIELLPQTQKSIIQRAKNVSCRVYVATNLLETMVSMPTPTRAEVNDIYNTLADGADGLVLAAETAIGKYPIQCVSMVSKVIGGFQRDELDGGRFYPLDAVSLLMEPHGGRLVHREAGPADLDDIERLPRLAVPERELMDCEQFGYGTYSPLTGFMDRETLESVLNTYRLPSGEVWTLPILLQVNSEDGAKGATAFALGDRVALTDEQGTVHALLDISQIYRYDLESLAARMYGTISRNHPGVARLMDRGDCFLGGDVTLVQPLASPIRHYLLTPAQTRFIFTRLGWSKVVGFHGRNPAHRGHELIQLQALECTGADGIYINPVAGPKKPGDFLPEPILFSYQTLLEFGCYPKGRVVLGCFFTYSRYAGPREAVFTALCRKNMGCSHFIVGRDHTGVGNFYPRGANRELFESLGDIGVKPVFFETVGYNSKTGKYEVEQGQPLTMISGTEVRETLRAGKHLPDWFMRDLVQEVLLAEMRSGKPMFYE